MRTRIFGDGLVGAAVTNIAQLELFSIDPLAGYVTSLYNYSGFTAMGSVTTLNDSTLLLSAATDADSLGASGWGFTFIDDVSVPEPNILFLFLFGLIGLNSVRRKVLSGDSNPG